MQTPIMLVGCVVKGRHMEGTMIFGEIGQNTEKNKTKGKSTSWRQKESIDVFNIFRISQTWMVDIGKEGNTRV